MKSIVFSVRSGMGQLGDPPSELHHGHLCPLRPPRHHCPVSIIPVQPPGPRLTGQILTQILKQSGSYVTNYMYLNQPKLSNWYFYYCFEIHCCVCGIVDFFFYSSEFGSDRQHRPPRCCVVKQSGCQWIINLCLSQTKHPVAQTPSEVGQLQVICFILRGDGRTLGRPYRSCRYMSFQREFTRL